MRLPVLFSVIIGIVVVACADAHVAARSVFENLDTAVRLEVVGGGGNSHPAVFTEDQIRVLLTSISARKKVGLLQSFLGKPGAPRLFDEADLQALVAPIRNALSIAAPNEAITFYREYRSGTGRIEVTTGSLFVRGDTVSLSVANLRHPVLAVPGQEGSDTGREVRLQDVRQTPDYVREHPRLSVGEQDFAIFFDDARYQAERHSSLIDYPERTLEIAYKPFLAANPDPKRRTEEVQAAMQSATMGKAEGQAIAELNKKVAELEAANKALASKVQETPVVPVPVPPTAAVVPPRPSDDIRDSLARLMEMVKRLEERMTSLERQLQQKTPKKKK